MPRTDDDNWDLASSVGATATFVASGRAMATKDPRGLINDPFAEPLVRAVGLDFFTKMMDGELDISTIDGASPGRLQAMVDGMAVRTKYFDDYFIDATGAGIRQAVILASGLDARAYRLPWPAGTVVYELDQPQVIEFKTTTLAGIGAEPTATRRTVPVDLRQDWPAALKATGLDLTAPTAWLAEGLLIYLPPEAQDRLFDNITDLRRRAARSPPNLSPALWISMPSGCGRCPVCFGNMAWTSTWHRWCTPASVTTSSTTCGQRGGTSRE
jgi:methyltransferase (TIGR00027 family)